MFVPLGNSYIETDIIEFYDFREIVKMYRIGISLFIAFIEIIEWLKGKQRNDKLDKSKRIPVLTFSNKMAKCFALRDHIGGCTTLSEQ